MVDRLAELGALQYAAANTATASVNPSRIAASGYIHAMYAEYVTWSLANPGVNPSRLSAKGRIFGYFYDNATFSPLSLFAASEVGVWYDPSDLSTMFQDAAGTTPVTADGQPVGKILDKSGRGNHASQATAAKRPLYKTSGGLHWLQFDGVDDALATASIDFTSTDKTSVFSGIRKTSDASLGYVVDLGENSYSNPGFNIMAPKDLSDDSYGFSLYQTALASCKVEPFSAPITSVVSCLFDYAGTTISDEIKPRVDGQIPTLTVNSAGPAGVGNFPSANLYIGRRSDGFTLNGNIYSLIVLGRLATTQEITDTETWVAAKTGVTL